MYNHMGNLLVASTSTFVPLFNHLVTIPYLYHPQRWGGIPWVEPGGITVGILEFVFNIITLLIMGTLSGMMTTQRECNKINVRYSIKRSLWVILGYLVGNTIVYLLPFIKAPVLAMLIWMPYAGWVAHGLLVAFSVLLFGAMGNAYQRWEICHEKEGEKAWSWV
jgi:uncharacterized protein YacL